MFTFNTDFIKKILFSTVIWALENRDQVLHSDYNTLRFGQQCSKIFVHDIIKKAINGNV